MRVLLEMLEDLPLQRVTREEVQMQPNGLGLVVVVRAVSERIRGPTAVEAQVHQTALQELPLHTPQVVMVLLLLELLVVLVLRTRVMVVVVQEKLTEQQVVAVSWSFGI